MKRNKFGHFAKGHLGYWKNKNFSPDHKQKMSETHKGDKNPSWKGGKIRGSQGYVWIYKPNHPFAISNHAYVAEHRFVMEEHLGRYLTPKERVHHINGIKTDNRIKNLKLFSSESSHQKFHKPKGSLFGINLKDSHQ